MQLMSPLKIVRLADNRRPSAEEVALAVGITQSFYTLVENGKRAASTELAQSLAAYFKVDVDTIFTPTRYASEPAEAAA